MAYLRKPLSTWMRPSTSEVSKPGAGLVPHGLQELDTRLVLGLARPQPLAGVAQPAQVGQALVDLVEARLGRRQVRHRGRQCRTHGVGQRLLDLRAGPGWRPGHPGRSGHAQQHGEAGRVRACPSSCLQSGLDGGQRVGHRHHDGRRVAPALHLDRAGLQAAVGDHHAQGTPISSQSANIAPGRSPRSSSSTSTPSAASWSCSARPRPSPRRCGPCRSGTRPR
jgi:hypothetical protein